LNIEEQNNAPQESLGEHLSRGQRSHQTRARLQDYICYTAQYDPSYAHSTPLGSSSTPYPIAHYVNCNNFSTAHKKFLAAVTEGKEAEHFGEAMKCKKMERCNAS
jgi:hypothetical protein